MSPSTRRQFRFFVFTALALGAFYVGGCSAAVVRLVLADDQLAAPIAERLEQDPVVVAKFGTPIVVRIDHLPSPQVDYTTAKERFLATISGPRGQGVVLGNAKSFSGLPWNIEGYQTDSSYEAAEQRALADLKQTVAPAIEALRRSLPED